MLPTPKSNDYFHKFHDLPVKGLFPESDICEMKQEVSLEKKL